MRFFLISGAILFAFLPAMAEEKLSHGGKVVEACWKNEQSHADKMNCEAKEAQKLRQKMVETYHTRIMEARKVDAEMREMGSAADQIEKSIIESQMGFNIS